MVRYAITVLSVLAVLLTVAMPISAADDDRDAIKKRLKERYPALLALESAQKVGEVFDGSARAVKPEYLKEKLDPDDPKSLTIREFLEKENTDRGKLFVLIAKGRDITPAQVGLLFGKKAFKEASPDHYLRPKGVDWVLKKNLKLEEGAR